jgi:photosystem II stability/assembly factor-like uncharacterized protein
MEVEYDYMKTYLPKLLALLLALGCASPLLADVAIDANTFGAIEAREIGPATMSGRIMAIEGVNSDPRIIYVGSASGGLWKTINGGVKFKPVFDKYAMSIGALAIDQSRPDTVWVGTGETCVRNSVSLGTGLYKTTDGGENWTEVGFKDSERISRIVIDPTNSDIVYVAVLGHLWNDHAERGVYKTTDGGKTWTQLLYVDVRTGCADLAMDPKNPATLYAAMWEFRRSPYFFESGGKSSALYKSTDAGKTWRKLAKGLPSGNLGRIGLAVSPVASNHIFATVESSKNGVFHSSDFGETWSMGNTGFNQSVRPFYFSHAVADPVDSLRFYKMGLTLTVSDDGGQSFTTPFRGGGEVHGDLHALWINPNDKNYMVVGTDGGAYISNDRGNTWKAFQNLPLAQCYRVHVDMESPYRVYIGLQDNGTWYAPSRSPNGINNKDWKPVGFGDGFHLVRDPADNENIYWQFQGGQFFRHNEVTGDHQSITPQPEQGEPKLRFNWNAGFATSPNRFGSIYCGAQYLYRSNDKGVSWTKLSGDLTTNDPKKQRQEESGGLTIDNSTAENHCTIFSISESPVDSMVIWVGTDDGNVQVTANDGKSWTNARQKIAGVPKDAWCSSVQASPHDRSSAFVTFTNHQMGDMKPYVYRTSDMGKTWTSLGSDSIKGYAWIIQQDHVNPELLFLGTEFGLWVSIDGGRQWAQFTGNLPKVSVRDIVIHPRDPDVIVATHGRGVMILDDITPLRNLTTAVLESDAAMLPSRPATTEFIGFEQGWRGDDEFTGGNPEDVAAITYYLKKRHMFGDLKVEVYDATGKLMASLPGGKRRGINRVYWYLREKPPKVAPSANMDNFLIGPQAPLGTYTVKLVRPSDTLTSTVSVILDPKSRHSEADRTLQDKTIRELYAMQNDLAYVAEVVLQIRDTARARASALGEKDSLAKSIRKYADRVDSLHKTLVATKEGWLTGEEQLREKVVELYGWLMFYSGRPTQSQLTRLAVLKSDLNKAQGAFETFAGTELATINEQLAGKNLGPIQRVSREDWDKKQN